MCHELIKHKMAHSQFSWSCSNIITLFGNFYHVSKVGEYLQCNEQHFIKQLLFQKLWLEQVVSFKVSLI